MIGADFTATNDTANWSKLDIGSCPSRAAAYEGYASGLIVTLKGWGVSAGHGCVFRRRRRDLRRNVPPRLIINGQVLAPFWGEILEAATLYSLHAPNTGGRRPPKPGLPPALVRHDDRWIQRWRHSDDPGLGGR